jgi:two-component system, chemotaxis family, CheB/CheR fusion protein
MTAASGTPTSSDETRGGRRRRPTHDTGLVDPTLPAERIGARPRRPAEHGPTPGAEARATDRVTVDAVAELVTARTGVVLAAYKRSTLNRRIKRRMALQRCDRIAAYYALLQRSPREVEQLLKDVFVSATSFCRDPAAFAALKEVLRELIEEREASGALRIWVPGCGSGEEAYSIAILIADILGDRLKQRSVEIFATDIDDGALQHGRRGIYADSAIRDVPEAYRTRYFVRSVGITEVASFIRHMVVFGRQDVLKDPPFSRLDLISCRNLVRYLDPAVHERLFALFHHVLPPNGFLMLGMSEAPPDNDLFEPIDPENKIYARRSVVRPVAPTFPVYRHAASFDPPLGWPERRRAEPGAKEVLQAPRPASSDDITAIRLIEVEEQLATARRTLRMTVNELEITRRELISLNKKLESANEELQSANEELQSSNEQLRASNEELQSTNEELIEANDELEVQGRRLRVALADFANILRSVGLPMLVIDDRLMIKHYTAEAEELFALQQVDVGQSVARVPRLVELPTIQKLFADVIHQGEVVTTNLADKYDNVYVIRIVPYRTDDKVGGAIISFVDITGLERAKRDLQRQSEWLDTVTNSVPALIGYLDHDMKLRFANRTFEEYYGAGIAGWSLKELLGEREFLRARPHLEEAVREARPTWFEALVETPNHAERAFMIGLVPDRRADGTIAGFFKLAVDITARKQAERALAESEERYRQLVMHAPDAILTHAEGRITFVNPAAAFLFAADSPDQLVGLPLLDLMEPWSRETIETRSAEAEPEAFRISGERWRCRRQDGELVDVEVASIPHDTEGGSRAQLIMRNITERVRVEERMRYLAHHDALTGLPNRAYFHARLIDALAVARRRHDRVALHLLDLDHFKEVNDAHGHDIGDALLKDVAGQLQSCVRQTDTVARLGGDEFAVVQTALANAEDATVLAQKLIDAVDRRCAGFSEGRAIGVTIGIAVFPDDDDDPDQLLRKADIALYRAKDDGRNRYLFFIDQFNEITQDRRRLLAALPAARQRSELDTYYQPILQLDDNRVVALEALLRWRHPRRGRLDAERFIDIAESAGHLREITQWQLRQVCAQVQEWRAAGLPELRVAINLSLSQLRSGSLSAQVLSILREFEIEPARFEFELTEHAAVQPGAREAARALQELHDLGAMIALDDFGTGQSSLMLLKRLPVDRLKIDRSFVSGINLNPNDNAIVRAIVQLALSLRLGVTAEGVERLEQLEFLRHAACPEAQGYLVASPIPGKEVIALLGADGRIPLQGMVR